MRSFFSDRLRFRPYEANDFPHAFRLQSDAEVMRYIRPPAQEASEVLERTKLWLDYALNNPGYGVLIIEEKNSLAFVGYVVIRHVEFQPGREVELGYNIDPAHWGLGYATEATQCLIKYARESLEIKTLVAFTDEANVASNRVLEKCGFVSKGLCKVYGADCLRWVL